MAAPKYNQTPPSATAVVEPISDGFANPDAIAPADVARPTGLRKTQTQGKRCIVWDPNRDQGRTPTNASMENARPFMFWIINKAEVEAATTVINRAMAEGRSLPPQRIYTPPKELILNPGLNWVQGDLWAQVLEESASREFDEVRQLMQDGAIAVLRPLNEAARADASLLTGTVADYGPAECQAIARLTKDVNLLHQYMSQVSGDETSPVRDACIQAFMKRINVLQGSSNG